MKQNEVFQLLAFFGLLVALTPLLGTYMARMFDGAPRKLERWIYRLGGVRADEEMSWKRYFAAVLLFNVIGIITLMAIVMTQAWLPLNPQKFPNVPWALALNTAVSFITNTN